DLYASPSYSVHLFLIPGPPLPPRSISPYLYGICERSHCFTLPPCRLPDPLKLPRSTSAHRWRALMLRWS
ncbi:unnamed protein product, partial [Nesidiocoris tenuis]